MSDEKLYMSYNHIHKICKTVGQQIKEKFNPDLMIAIGGGGFIPARILRTFLKTPGSKNIHIQAIGLSLYEDLNSISTDAENAGMEVKRIQWVDFSSQGVNLIGRRILIVDEVDDTRTTLHYAIAELEKDVRKQAQEKGIPESEAGPDGLYGTKFGVFVLHNKDKPKRADIPQEILKERYFVGDTYPDVWIAYPWESTEIDEHTEHAVKQGLI